MTTNDADRWDNLYGAIHEAIQLMLKPVFDPSLRYGDSGYRNHVLDAAKMLDRAMEDYLRPDDVQESKELAEARDEIVGLRDMIKDMESTITRAHYELFRYVSPSYLGGLQAKAEKRYLNCDCGHQILRDSVFHYGQAGTACPDCYGHGRFIPL